MPPLFPLSSPLGLLFLFTLIVLFILYLILMVKAIRTQTLLIHIVTILLTITCEDAPLKGYMEYFKSSRL